MRRLPFSVQPRIRLTHSFNERTHSYLGYALRVRGTIGDEEREFLVGIGKGIRAKHRVRAGDTMSRAEAREAAERGWRLRHVPRAGSLAMWGACLGREASTRRRNGQLIHRLNVGVQRLAFFDFC